MAKVWLTLYFAPEENGDFSPKCKMCDGVILIPRDPNLLADGVPYLEGSIITGPTLQGGQIKYIVDYEADLLRDPERTVNQCDFMICCNDCSPKMVKLITDIQNARIAAVEALTGEIENPQMSVILGQQDLVDTANNSGSVFYADPLATFSAEFNSIVKTFTNPSGARWMNVAIDARSGVAFYNESLTKAHSLYIRAYIKINGVVVASTIIDEIRIAALSQSGGIHSLFPLASIAVAPNGSIDIQAGIQLRRESGTDPADMNSLRVDARNVKLTRIFGVTT